MIRRSDTSKRAALWDRGSHALRRRGRLVLTPDKVGLSGIWIPVRQLLPCPRFSSRGATAMRA